MPVVGRSSRSAHSRLAALALALGAACSDDTSPVEQTAATSSGTTAVASASEGPTTSTGLQEPTTGVVGGCGDGVRDGDEQCDDGAANGVGQACKADCTANVCGDHDRGPDEACDEGSQNGTVVSECTAACAINVCGDGVRGLGELCDAGAMNGPNGACTAECQPNVCGDGNVGPDESCDDANDDDDDGCTQACGPPTCGDGLVSAGEACDDGNHANTDLCTVACAVASCGDGWFQESAGEQCDDGPMNSDDGDCSATCELTECGDGLVNTMGRAKEECDLGPGNGPDKACTAECLHNVCGDGYAGPGEECDDGDDDDTDACVDDCKLATCGDKHVWSGHELCDDGNLVDGDGCDDCVGAKRVFVSSASYTGALGGVAGARAKCQALAEAAQLGGTWDAWIGLLGDSPVKRFVKSPLGYKKLDGTVIADTWADLTDQTLDAPIDLTEKLTIVSAETWTGVTATGTSSSDSCVDWTSGASFFVGENGHTKSVDFHWTQDGANPFQACDVMRRLYCFEQ
jgi:cysteine-rich repeat protein